MAAARCITSVRRAPDRDVVLPPPHPLASILGSDSLDIVTHASGGVSLKAGYRDQFYTSADDADLVVLVGAGLFRQRRVMLHDASGGDPHAYFHLTDLGRLVAAGQQPRYPDA